MASVLQRKLNTALSLSGLQLAWLLPLYLLSGCYRLLALTLPFKTIAKRFISSDEKEDTTITGKELARAQQFGQIIKLVSRYTPWDSNCLVQALLANTILSLYKIPHQGFIGVKKSAGNESTIDAHAWIKCGDTSITGGDADSHYQAIT